MIVLYIIGGLLLLILLLLCAPVSVEAVFEQAWKFKIRYLFIPVYQNPRKEKKPESTKGKIGSFLENVNGKIKKGTQSLKAKLFKQSGAEKKEEKPKASGGYGKEKKKGSAFSELLEERGVSGLFDMITHIAAVALKRVGRIFRGIVIDRLLLDIAVGGEDAAQTAISYGRWSAVFFPAMSIILSSVRECRHRFVRLSPDFNSEETHYECSVKFRVFPLLVVHHALGALFEILWGELKGAVKRAIGQKTAEAGQFH